MNKIKLYKMRLSADFNENLSPRTEYLRSRIKLDDLIESVRSWCRLPTTEYYGYTDVKITEERDLPEIVSLTLDPDKFSKKQFEKIRKHKS